MSVKKANTPAQPGDTFIAYVDDETAIVGVVTEEGSEDGRDFKALILGHLKEHRASGSIDVFAQPFQYTFPGYMSVQKRRVVPYDFKQEIALCKARDSAWWKSLDAPCYTNLVAKHFRPRQLQELQYIDMARFILSGGDIDTFKSFGHWSDRDFLRLWAVLYHHFPEKVKLPPREHDDDNTNGFHTINLEKNPPTVVWAIRPTEYKKDPNNLSIY